MRITLINVSEIDTEHTPPSSPPNKTHINLGKYLSYSFVQFSMYRDV